MFISYMLVLGNYLSFYYPTVFVFWLIGGSCSSFNTMYCCTLLEEVHAGGDVLGYFGG